LNKRTSKLISLYSSARRLHEPDVKAKYEQLPPERKEQARAAMLEHLIVRQGSAAHMLPEWIRKEGARFMPPKPSLADLSNSVELNPAQIRAMSDAGRLPPESSKGG